MKIRHAVCIALFALATPAFSDPADLLQTPTEKTYEVLETKSGTFSNVTVTTKSKNYIFILHSRGMANIKIQDLPLEVQQELGYAPASDDQKSSNRGVVLAKQLVPELEAKIKPLEAQVQSGIRAGRQQFEMSPMLIAGVLAVFFFLYLFFSYCAHLICIKAGQPPSALIWIPALQMIPLLRAAGMSGWLFLLTLLPIANLVVHIIWCFKIASARGKSAWVGLCLLLPVLGLFAFLYLAFSDSESSDDDASTKSISLQAA